MCMLSSISGTASLEDRKEPNKGKNKPATRFPCPIVAVADTVRYCSYPKSDSFSSSHTLPVLETNSHFSVEFYPRSDSSSSEHAISVQENQSSFKSMFHQVIMCLLICITVSISVYILIFFVMWCVFNMVHL